MKIYTLGYGGRKPSELLQLLTDRRIRTVVDVRLRPDQSAFGAFRRSKSPGKGIERLLAEQGIGYVPLIEMGNLFMESEDWRNRYRQLLDCAGDLLLRGLDNIADPICLLCAERNVADCHRSLIAEALARRGHGVEHIA